MNVAMTIAQIQMLTSKHFYCVTALINIKCSYVDTQDSLLHEFPEYRYCMPDDVCSMFICSTTLYLVTRQEGPFRIR